MVEGIQQARKSTAPCTAVVFCGILAATLISCAAPITADAAVAAAPLPPPQPSVLPAALKSPSERRLDIHEMHREPRHESAEMPASSKGRRVPAILPQDIARAKKHLEKGLAAYRKGDYDAAEEHLKQAMTLYPFFAEANLALGKIFLIRGSATLDRALINNARLMFEMAHTLDPTLRETDLLLELFQTGTPP